MAQSQAQKQLQKYDADIAVLQVEFKNLDSKFDTSLADVKADVKEVSEKLNLKTKVFQKNIFEIKNLETGTIMSRAFKPMPVVIDLVYENFSNIKI